MDARRRSAIAEALGSPLVSVRALAGGSISDAWAVELGDGRRVFAKTHEHPPPGMFAAEVRGLAFLREGLRGVEGLSVPEALAHGSEFLVLELVERGPARSDFDELLGRGLAALHRSEAGLGLGLDHDNFIADLAQDNTPLVDRPHDWPSFYRARRLEPMLARAGGLISLDLRHRFDALFERLPALCGPAELAARLHGDLWAGNLLADARGRPVLIDPAVYVGHREVDLAMMRLFGGFSARTFAAYAEVWPLADGWARRVDLYQLYPLLTHVVLFGRSYVGAVADALDRLC
jgi:fructosamine-3-kinase